MPRNGTGGYTLPPGINPVMTQTLITSNWANTTMNDLAAAITQSLSKDGQTVPTADLPMGGFKHTGVGDPVLRNNYSSLGFVQDGKHLRLTGVAGVNAVTGTLPGGATGFVVGQIVQLIPTSTNTSAATLSINATAAVPIVTDIGSPLAQGNLIAGRTYLLSYTGAAWQIISASGGVAGFAQAAMSGWDRPSVGGAYPSITLVNPTTVFVPGGTGRIIRPSTRDLSGVREVTWAGQNVTIENVATAWTTMLGVNSNGQIIQFTGNFSPAWARDYILLGTVAHLNGQINEITTQPAIYGDMTYAAYDTGYLLNNTLVSGGKVLPNAASPFHVDIQAGIIFSLGIDSIDVNGPNTGNFPAVFDLSFFPITGTSGISAATQNVPVTQYDPLGAGVITAIPGGATTATIHRLFLIAGEYVLLYGQAVYADLVSALSQLSVDDASLVYPSKLVNATLLCYIAVQKNCTDLKNATTARIVAKGGTNFSIGTAGSISEAPINGLLYGRVNAAWNETIPAPKGPQATLRQIYYYTNTFARWSEGADDIAEGGANTGSNWVLRRYNDAGTLLGTALEINRATGAVFIDGPVSVQDTIFMDTALGQSLSVYAIGAGLPINGAAPGIRAANYDTAAGSNIALSFSHTDSTDAERHAASIVCGKEGPWTGGSGLYPAFLSFYTRVSGGAQVEQLRIASTGVATFTQTPFVGANPILVSGGAGAFSSVTTDLLKSNTGPLEIATVGLSTVQINPRGPGTGAAAQFQVQSDGTVDMRGFANVTVNLQAKAAGQANLVFQNVTTGELGRIFGTLNTLTFQTGAAPATRLTLSNTGAVFTVPVTSSQVFQGAAATVVLSPTGVGTIYLRPNGGASAVGEATVGSDGAFNAAGDVRATTNFASLTATAILGTTGAGNIRFRPNGVGSAVGEVSVSAAGNVLAAGDITANNFVATTNGNAVFGPAGSGNVILRPQGPANATGQLLLTNGGELRITADYVATGLIATLAATGAGSVRLRPNGVASAVGEVNVETSGRTTVNSTLRVLGQLDATTGTGVDIYWTGSAGTIIAINRATAVWQPCQLAGSAVSLRNNAGGVRFACDDTGIAFFAGATAAKQTVTGSRAGNAALTSLLTALALYGLITNSSSA